MAVLSLRPGEPVQANRDAWQESRAKDPFLFWISASPGVHWLHGYCENGEVKGGRGELQIMGSPTPFPGMGSISFFMGW